MKLTPVCDLLIGFGVTLRGAGFIATSDQGLSFLQSIDALGPESLEDIRRAARAVYGPPPERRAEFDTLFDAHFLGRVRVQAVQEDAEESLPEPGTRPLILDGEQADMPGQTASGTAVIGTRQFAAVSPQESLRRFARLAPRRLPDRQARRTKSGSTGRTFDRVKTLRTAMRHDGEILKLIRRARLRKLRQMLVLIDISGSMKTHTEDALRVAHMLMQLSARVEVFSMGTELTRLTRHLRAGGADRALAQVAEKVRDFDGGTRLGGSLSRLLENPQWAALARGAVVITVSDGLEIGTPDRLVQVAERLSRLAFAHIWLTPLALDRGFQPRTEALQAIAPFVDEFGSAGSIQTICAHLLGDDYLAEVPT